MQCGGYAYFQTSGHPVENVNQQRNVNQSADMRGFCADVWGDDGRPFITTMTHRTMEEVDADVGNWIERMEVAPVRIPTCETHERRLRGIVE